MLDTPPYEGMRSPRCDEDPIRRPNETLNHNRPPRAKFAPVSIAVRAVSGGFEWSRRARPTSWATARIPPNHAENRSTKPKGAGRPSRRDLWTSDFQRPEHFRTVSQILGTRATTSQSRQNTV